MNGPATPSLYLLVAGLAAVCLIISTVVAAISAREFARGERTLRRLSSDIIWMTIPTSVVAVILMWSLSSRYVSLHLDRSIGVAAATSRESPLP